MIRRAIAAVAAVLSAAAGLAGAPAFAEAFSAPAIEGEYPLYDRSTALLIGVSDYEEWSSLRGVRRNIRDLDAFLTDRGFQVTSVVDATAQDIRNAIELYLSEKVDARTRSIIYFAGHGWLNPRPGARDPVGFLVARDTPSPDSIRGEAFSTFIGRMRAASVTDRDIRAFAQDSRARHTLFLIDSCFSGAIFGQRSGYATRIGHPLPSINFWEQLGRPSSQYITVGNEYEKTPADSPLVDLFIQGVETGAEDPRTPYVTASEVSLWLRRNLSPRGDLTPQWGWVTAGAGEMVFRTGNRARFTDPRRTEPEPHRIRMTSNAPFSQIEIYYYRKTADGSAVLDVLDELDVPHVVRQMTAETPVNAIGCHPEIEPDLLRELARRLIRAGVPLRSIREFSNPEDKRDRFDIFTATLRGETRLLTVDDINALEGCPPYFVAQ